MALRSTRPRNRKSATTIMPISSAPFHPDNPMDPGAAFDALCAAAAGRWPVVDVVSGSVSE